MDFEFHYTKEQEEFRKEVRAWIEEHALKEPVEFIPPTRISVERYLLGQESVRKLGEKGWFAPGYPKKYGGGGLDVAHRAIVIEELARIVEERCWLGGTQISAIMTGGIMSQGTEEQKLKYLPPMLRGEWRGWQCFTEPEAGTDEASMQSTAVPDGDVFVINGHKIYVGMTPVPHNFKLGTRPDPVTPEFLYWPAVTEPEAPRHENLSAFFIPGDLPGIEYRPLDLIAAEGQKWEVICHDVRCPADRLIGEKGKGWLVTQATLAAEHGAGGTVVRRITLTERLIDYCKNTRRNGKPISSDPSIQDLLVQLYIESRVGQLWGLRNFAMAQGQIPRIWYTGTQTSLHGKRFSPKLGRIVMEILGPYCLLDDRELRVLEGRVEHQVRLADVTHIAGTPETQMILMSRALGLGRGAARRRQ